MNVKMFFRSKVFRWQLKVLSLSVAFCCVASCTKDSSEQQALDFLYANMPLPDSVDYPKEFWEANVAVSLRAPKHDMYALPTRMQHALAKWKFTAVAE